MKTVTLKLPPELDAKLSALARRQHTTKSDVARQALEAYFNGSQESKSGTIAELAADLIGSVDGPGDLSHNPGYMHGFGK